MRLATYTLRELLRRPGRTLLTLLGIAVGVAAGVATSTAVSAAHRAYRELSEGVGGEPFLEVAAPGHAGFDPALLAGLRSAPGVRAVVPCVQTTAAVVGAEGATPVRVLGLSPAQADAAAESRDRDGDLPAEGDGILLGAGVAEGTAVGQPVRLWSPKGLTRLPLSGRLNAAATGSLAGATAVVPLATAQRLFALPGQVNSARLVLAEGAGREQVEAAVAKRLPPGLSLQPSGGHAALGRATFEAAELGLDLLGLMAAVAAAFVVLNTFLLNLGERRRQLAALRTLGATRGQLTLLLLREAALLGTAGAAVGLPLGLALSWLLGRAVGQFLGVVLPPPRPGVAALLLAAALGPGAALAATWWPVRRAARRDPLPELLGQDRGGDGRPRWAAPAGLVLLAAGGTAEIGLLRGWWPPAAGRALLAPVFALLLIGCVLVLPLAIPALLGACAGLGRLFGVEGRLALLQLHRRRSRTALTAGVIFLAVAVALAFGHALQATLDDLSRWYRRTITADFLVRGSQPDTAFLLASAVPEALGEEIAGVDGVADVDKLAFVPGRAAGRSVMVLARTFGDGPLPLDLREGTAEVVAAGLRRSEVVLGTVLAGELGLHAGDTLELETRDGPRPLRVAGTAAEYAAGGRALYLEWEAARRLLPLEGPHCFLVRARPGAAAALAAPLGRFCHERGLLMQSNDSLRELIDRLLAGVRGALWGLAALGFVVAGLGIANTMTMSVLEQARELAVLRAVGMRRRQVGRLVLAQAVLTGVAGSLPGTVAGLGLAWLLSSSTARLLGSAGRFRVGPGLVAGCAIMALTTAVVAALLPARRAQGRGL